MLFVGDDWAEDHHDVELQDETGRVLGRAKLPEGVAGIGRLHAMIGEHLGEDDEATVVVGIETDRGPWVQALIAAGYQVYAINPLQVARYRERRGVSGAKSDTGDAHALADMVRTDRHQLRPVAGDSAQAEAVKVLSRVHKTLIWDRTRQMLRLRHALREFFPAALVAFDDLTAPEALELLGAAPEPTAAAALSTERINEALKRARRHGRAAKAEAIAAALRAEHLGQPPVVATAFAATVRAHVAILGTLNAEIKTMGKEIEAHFSEHPDAEVYLSQPGLGVVLGARVLAEFGDDKQRYADARARKNYAGTSPITRQSGKKKVVLARYVHNDRLVDALGQQAFTALNNSPGARTYYDQLRAKGVGHRAALRQLGNRLVGILHGCLKTGKPYSEDIAWAHHRKDLDTAA
ncbi:IS110 family transposase [Phytohabitans flavus]|uniref:IS110 family transposase n=1 Tax=Phytohabitans flavus TaxID=1076124 RepID=A0A6F8XXL2_9ACTN|nr:IS110 family transposase [Phytohabitans flavus]BCB73736.1 IS110 family transposase [Phytohabitans flavus]BCB74423.1 IS110 family transposase [Phytohabitans flavus]BCB77244.1 IS110 family transposase [Phytohabitans flavus]BCB78104.1 IS110 family transposase [Phytohabitans flavus]BCB78478.1 IS110 family transposase [Phytohabitans flavus]